MIIEIPIFRFEIPGRLPGLNELIKVSRGTKGKGSLMAAARQKKNWTNRVALHILNQLPRGLSTPIPYPIFVKMIWVEIDKGRDPDNIVSAKKYLFDGMIVAKLIKKDGWKNIAGFKDRWIVDKKKPGVVVTIFKLEV